VTGEYSVVNCVERSRYVEQRQSSQITAIECLEDVTIHSKQCSLG